MDLLKHKGLLIGGAVAAAGAFGVYEYFIKPAVPSPAAPAPLLALAQQPGAILIQPDLTTLKLVPGATAGAPVALSFDEVATLQGHEVGRVTHAAVPIVSQTPATPTQADVKATVLMFYGAGVPGNVSASNASGPNWVVGYSAAIQHVDATGAIVSRTMTGSVVMTQYPSTGPQPPVAATNSAVYSDLLSNM